VTNDNDYDLSPTPLIDYDLSPTPLIDPFHLSFQCTLGAKKSRKETRSLCITEDAAGKKAHGGCQKDSYDENDGAKFVVAYDRGKFE